MRAPISHSSTSVRVASRSAFFTARMSVTWLPMWKCSSSRQSSLPSRFSTSTTSTIWRVVRPNFERSPPESLQRPEPLPPSLERTPMAGLMPSARRRAGSSRAR
jgi:hypothetical protein